MRVAIPLSLYVAPPPMSPRPLSLMMLWRDIKGDFCGYLQTVSIQSSDILLTQNHFKNAVKLLSIPKYWQIFAKFLPPTRNDGLWEDEVETNSPQGASGGNKDRDNHGAKWNWPHPLLHRACKKYPTCLETIAKTVRDRTLWPTCTLSHGQGSARWSVEGPGGSGWNGELKEAEKCYIGQLGAATRRGTATGY